MATHGMRIGYGTYGMPEVPIWEALPRLAEMGYEAVELCGADRWPTAPAKLSSADRSRLSGLLQDLGLALPALMHTLNLLAPDGGELEEQESRFREICALARDLSPAGDPAQRPVIANVLGHCGLEWREALPLIVERVERFGRMVADEGCRLALEPHVGPLLNSPERALELMRIVHSPSVGINFDISHFEAIGIPRAVSTAALVPFALHTHVKDAQSIDGRVQFLLPGEGDFDYVAYFREMAAAGWKGCVTVEVSAQIFNRPGYDPWEAAAFSLNTLREARVRALG